MALSENKQILFYFVLAAGVISLLGLISRVSPQQVEQIQQQANKSYLVVNEQKVFVEVMDSVEKRSQGLSGRKSLGQDEGVLFIFPQPGLYSFWMKEMRFNLDFVFIHDQVVVDLIEDVPYPQPKEAPQKVKSKAEFDKVLEINAGKIEEWGIEIDDQLEFFL